MLKLSTPIKAILIAPKEVIKATAVNIGLGVETEAAKIEFGFLNISSYLPLFWFVT